MSSSGKIYCFDPFKRHKAKQTDVVDPSDIAIGHGKVLNIDLVGKKICRACKRTLKERAEAKTAQETATKSDISEETERMVIVEAPSAAESRKMDTEQSAGASTSGYNLRRTPPKPFPHAAEHKLEKVIGKRTPSPPDKSGSDGAYDDNYVLEKLNALLGTLGCDKMNESSLRSRIQFDTVVKNIKLGLSKSVFKKAFKSDTSQDIDDCGQCTEMINELKQKFQKSTNRVEKYQILSLVARFWNANQIVTTFGVSRYVAENAIRMVGEQGILFHISKKIGSNTVPRETVNLVKEFYRSDEVSSDRPAMGDKKVVWENGVKMEKQIKLILMNLKEAHALFKEQYPNLKIGFSKFASLRPKECIPALDKRGMHAVCMCIYHQNTKLASDALIKNMNAPSDIKDYKGFCSKLMCEEPTDDCHLRTCGYCNNDAGLRKVLDEMFTDEFDRVTYKQWISIEHSKC